MSDTPPTREALRRALEHCSGGPGCPCGGTCAGRVPVAPPSPLAPPAAADDDSAGESSDDPSDDSDSGSETSSDAPVRYGVPVQEWDGLHSLTIEECEHNLMYILRNCWAGRDVGRRFLGCPLEDPSERCATLGGRSMAGEGSGLSVRYVA